MTPVTAVVREPLPSPLRRLTCRGLTRFVLAIAVLASAGVVAGCKGARSPEAAVEKVLELRSRNCTSTVEYSPYVSSDMAGQFAEDSAMRDPSTSPIPMWGAPTVISEGPSGVEVSVGWVPSESYPNWPVATIFVVQKFNGYWMLVDAYNSDETNSAPPPSAQPSSAADN